MLKRAHFLVIWILCLALPLQAIAAAVQMPCCIKMGKSAKNVASNCHEIEVSQAFDVSSSPNTDAPIESARIQEGLDCTCLDCLGSGLSTYAPPPLATIYSDAAPTFLHPRNAPTLFVGFVPDTSHRPPRIV